jgi:Rhodopirellula transposase DDE domain
MQRARREMRSEVIGRNVGPRTQTGLQLTAYLDRRYYPCGLKPSPDQLASLRLQRHDTLPEWNYTINPQL